MKCYSRLILISFFYLSTIIFYSCDTPTGAYDKMTRFWIKGIACEACVNPLTAKLTSDPRIVSAEIDVHGDCKVYHKRSITLDEIIKIVEDAGYEVPDDKPKQDAA